MMGRGAVLCLVVLATCASGGARAEPYGCWSLRDPTERLACFDLALGPPAAGSSQARSGTGDDRRLGLPGENPTITCPRCRDTR